MCMLAAYVEVDLRATWLVINRSGRAGSIFSVVTRMLEVRVTCCARPLGAFRLVDAVKCVLTILVVLAVVVGLVVGKSVIG